MLTRLFNLNQQRHLIKNVTKIENLFQYNRLNISRNQVANRTFSTSSKQNAIPPVLWLIVKPISKFVAIIAGRFVIVAFIRLYFILVLSL
jgi:hypothetical protein